MAIPNYFITGVWKNSNKVITHVFLHPNTYDAVKNTNTFKGGIKTTEADTIRRIKAGNIIETLRWNYLSASWIRGAVVEVVKSSTREFIRSHKDAQISDNLDNMIDMAGLF